jgi:hypothetical protein
VRTDPLTGPALPARLEPWTSMRGDTVGTDEQQQKSENAEAEAEDRDELDDLDVSEQQAEDVKGGARMRQEP